MTTVSLEDISKEPRVRSLCDGKFISVVSSCSENLAKLKSYYAVNGFTETGSNGMRGITEAAYLIKYGYFDGKKSEFVKVFRKK